MSIKEGEDEGGNKTGGVVTEHVIFLTNQNYVKNYPPSQFLREYNYKIPLENFVCYCVGVYNDEKVVHCLRIIMKSPSEKITTMQIEWFSPDSSRNESVTFWVSSGISLKKNFFLHTDQLNFFRSTFIYSPSQSQFFRLSSIQNFLFIPEHNPMGQSIYNTPLKFYKYKRKLTSSPNKLLGKRKKEFIKDVQKLKNKYNIDGFVENNYKKLYVELCCVTFPQPDK